MGKQSWGNWRAVLHTLSCQGASVFRLCERTREFVSPGCFPVGEVPGGIFGNGRDELWTVREGSDEASWKQGLLYFGDGGIFKSAWLCSRTRGSCWKFGGKSWGDQDHTTSKMFLIYGLAISKGYLSRTNASIQDSRIWALATKLLNCLLSRGYLQNLEGLRSEAPKDGGGSAHLFLRLLWTGAATCNVLHSMSVAVL